MTRLRILVAVVLTTGFLQAQACNPETAALNIFRRQGLVVLRPARDYIRVGGLVSLKQSTPNYRDPSDPVPSDPNVTTSFGGIVMAEGKKGSTRLGTALNLVGSIIPLPVGLKYSVVHQVNLAQIDTDGIRLISDALDAQILKPKTAAKTTELLKGGSRVFIIQEVYRAKSMDLSSSGNQAIEVSYGSGAKVDACPNEKPGASEVAEKAKTQAGDAKDAKKDPSAATKADSKERAADAKAEAEKDKPAEAKTGADAAAKPAADTTAKPETPATGVAVALCRSGEYGLKFQTKAAIPFAVRLAEIELMNGRLRIKEGKFKFPNSLGNSKAETTTADYGTQSPVIGNLTRVVD